MQVKNLPKNICALPFTAIHFRPNGEIAPCCDYGANLPDNHKRFYGNSAEEYKSSKLLKQIKKSFLKGEWPEGCLGCKYKEEQSGHSRRLQETPNFIGHVGAENECLTKDHLVNYQGHFYTNLAINNTCNLGCVMCHTSNSSFLEREYHENSNHFFKDAISKPQENHKIKLKNFKGEWNRTLTEKQIHEIVDSIDMSGTAKSRITFHGGEPTLLKELYEILNIIKKQNLQDKVLIEFNSNFQQFNAKWYDALMDFEGHAMASIDAIGDVGEYVRYPSDWNKVESNVLKFKEKYQDTFGITICPTIQSLNILSLGELIEWCNKHELGMTLHGLLNDPKLLAVNNLPTQIKESLINEISNTEYPQSYRRDERPFILKKLQQDATIDFDHVINYLNRIDNVRNTNWKKSLSKLYNLLDKS